MAEVFGQGKNASLIRKHNELAVLQLLRREGKASRIELAKKLDLTPQALAIITRNLLQNNLIKEAGRHYPHSAGKPPTIYALNAEGALSIGVSIGRTHLDVLLVNFCGTIYERKRHEYPYPKKKEVFDLINKAIETIWNGLNNQQQGSIVGMGISIPFYLYLWEEELQVPAGILSQWKGLDVAKEISNSKNLPLFLENDASAAAIAELFFGKGQELSSFLYLYIGSFVGGGVITEGKYISGHHNNAGALGPLLVPSGALQETKGPVQLLTRASLNELRKYLHKKGVDFGNFSELFLQLSKSGKIHDHVIEWADDVSESLAYATLNSTCVMDFEAIIIDGALPQFWADYITRQTEKKYQEIEHRGLIKPLFHSGNFGVDSRALGSAILPIYHKFGTTTTENGKEASQIRARF